jgi:hypothetical protein
MNINQFEFFIIKVLNLTHLRNTFVEVVGRVRNGRMMSFIMLEEMGRDVGMHTSSHFKHRKLILF